MSLLITDIARKARVSPATVSRVINQPHLVAPARLQQVRNVMSDLGYVPTPIHHRRGPKSRLPASRKIALWYVGARQHSNFNWFQDQLLQTYHSNERLRADLSVVFSDSPDEVPRALVNREVDGVIIQGMEPAPAALAQLGDLAYIWFMTRRTSTFAGDYVEPDNDLNGRMAAEYLQRRHFRTVAVIAAEAGYSAVAWRVRAFVEHARNLGMAVHSILGKQQPISHLEIDPAHDESDWLVKQFLAFTGEPIGVYIPVDHFCGSLFRSMRAAGLLAERDFEAILGNYNPIIYHNLDHLPAALDINLPALVRKGVDHLLWRIENPKIDGRIGITVAPSLISAVTISKQMSA